MRSRRPARSASRNSPTSTNVARDLIRRYGLAPTAADVRTVDPPLEPRQSDLRAMGPLVWLELIRWDGKIEFWDFAPEPNDVTAADRKWMPRVAYDERNSQLWFVGGSFRIDGNGFHRTRTGPCVRYGNAPCDITQARSRYSEANRDYTKHHGGLAPEECVAGSLVFPTHVVSVGRCRAAAYETNRNNGKGLINYKHMMAEGRPKSERRPYMPFVDVSAEGCRVFLRGGEMTIDDGGWMQD